MGSIDQILSAIWEVSSWVWRNLTLVALLSIGLSVVTNGFIRPPVIAGTIAYGSFLVVKRNVDFWVNYYRRRKYESSLREPVKPRVPRRSTDIVSAYSLAPLEVVLSIGRRIIKANFKRHHTLIAGVTGGGKTNLINLILIQLFGKGKRFTDVCDVYLFDFKADHKNDHLDKWKPLVKGFYPIGIDGSGLYPAIEKMAEISVNAHQDGSKFTLVIIDEVAAMISLHQDRGLMTRGTNVFIKLCSALRGSGTVIATTQYPRNDMLPTPARSNLERKIGLIVDGPTQVDLIFSAKPPRDMWPKEAGDILVKEPGKPGYSSGHAMLVDVPGDIDRVVSDNLILMGEEDERTRFFAEIASGLSVGASIVGANRRITEADAVGTPHMPQAKMIYWYRNFGQAGALIPPEKRGQQYKLAKPFPEAMKDVRNYIKAGKWMDSPEAFV